ncbi:MAG TPA: UDP-N-acetylmuramoyl-L-alanyl-D-glutamate--2,6-diaminopimelate ligase [Candidatus Portnoybacteria bacterium]|nr:UDP-N-acetylmuramoyl-L-alanyl-D-glutamate--2,6-diaminopimelate ligase [Candidatus Portnoybacteria bacterium]HOZ16434.1 UDP-N-acetylmuramoyl-L-alanyl-D-glutamate--2,6-diaminopimelate ligase [Candidatus Portnoybacteria bacterium]HPH52134.1 UDP-N-acetylmuramoyl-L-alanyl-D-glutamate--2,6-diaminopimelate ligase [Candidatus Portnoybacteria bacterium]HPJ80253.1 UDP-N-acetylmuramoyl-L-alanyl-D-glutamate--2,6-diaminopimelate ligase [Candidatus Portnoybacteria bacterium]
MSIKKLIPSFAFKIYHYFLALMGAIIYGFPSKKLIVIGITGTKGKSTTVVLSGKIFQEAGIKVGWVSSLTINYGEEEIINKYHMTMPGRFFIQSALAKMVKNGCKYAIIEVTSEGIKQFRHKFIKFSGAVFTNLAPEHIEAHGSFEKYRSAKLKLFKTTAKIKNNFGIYNVDDKNVEWFLKYSIKNKFEFSPKNDKIDLQMSLIGDFNYANALAALTIAKSQGISEEIAKQAFKKVKFIPGRMEEIVEGQNFRIFVDLAHTPDSFEKVFEAIKQIPRNKIISVFGAAGGGRDKWKRPELGRIASENSDIVILCNEDSYSENPGQIISEIKSGIQNTRHKIQDTIFEIEDRREAIKKAFLLAQKDDIVLILGKGTEQTMVIGKNKFCWDDREVVREELKKIML